MKEPDRRIYTQGQRAEKTAASTERILETTRTLVLDLGHVPGLDVVAAEAGVSVQTILRKFGSKEGLLRASAESAMARVSAERNAVTPGDVSEAIDNLLDHYDAWGDRSLRLLSLEGQGPTFATLLAGTRALHRAWVERAFGPQLAALALDIRGRRLAQLVALTDVYVWKLLHRDQGLDREDTRTALTELIEAGLGTPGHPTGRSGGSS